MKILLEKNDTYCDEIKKILEYVEKINVEYKKRNNRQNNVVDLITLHTYDYNNAVYLSESLREKYNYRSEINELRDLKRSLQTIKKSLGNI